LLASLPAAQRKQILAGLTEAQAGQLLYDWRLWARPNQLQPSGDWTLWLLLAGRGFGKTKTGAETVREWASKPLPAPIHLVAPTAADIRKVMIEGTLSGLLSCYPESAPDRPRYEPSLGHKLTWPNGNVAYAFSADEPERLRGPACCRFWADELAAWRFGQEAWDNLMFGFRAGDDLRGVITTTPKPIPLVKSIMADRGTVITRGSTYDNRRNLSAKFYQTVIGKYEGTRIGRQELMAELLEDTPGALWNMGLIDRARVDMAKIPPLVRVVVAIDPAVTANEDSDETGIGAAGIDERGHVYVLEDASLKGTPREWALAACRMMLKWNGDRVVAEVNNGGDLVEQNIRTIHRDIPFRAVRASRGKATRAEPVVALYEQGRVHHVRHGDRERDHAMEILESQLCGWVPGQTEKSPDRMDWLVWAIFDLIVDPMQQQFAVSMPHVQISPY
jgi:phage terminase large subunit-like protein